MTFSYEYKKQLVHYGLKMVSNGLTTGTGGNLSVCDRDTGQLAITPSGMDYDLISVEDIVVCDSNGRVLEGAGQPSSELGFHLALYKHRADISAVVHTHSPYATTLACLHMEIPAVHYLVGFSGHKVPLAPYATYGTPALADAIIGVVGDYNAVLLANHGMVAVGPNLRTAFTVAEEIELVARIYYQTLTAGEPKIISKNQMEEALAKFKTYGRR